MLPVSAIVIPVKWFAMEAPKSPPVVSSMPSEGVRGFVSLLLVVHLFAIGVALMAYSSASLLELKLLRALGPYLHTFNFGLTHVYDAPARLHLTHAGPSDVDFRISGETKGPNGTSRTWQIPRDGLFPPIRYHRDQSLANVVGGLMTREDEELEAVLPRTIATAELKRSNAQSGTVKVTAHFLQELEDLTASETSRRDPFDASYYRDVFDARAIAGPLGGVDLLKSSAKGEVAPVTGASGPNSSPKRSIQQELR